MDKLYKSPYFFRYVLKTWEGSVCGGVGVFAVMSAKKGGFFTPSIEQDSSIALTKKWQS